MMTEKTRIEEIRANIRAECVSSTDLIELRGLIDHIEPGDVELLEAAGIPEHEDERMRDHIETWRDILSDEYSSDRFTNYDLGGLEGILNQAEAWLDAMGAE